MRIEGRRSQCQYAGGWKSATQQNDDQAHALKGYFQDARVQAPGSTDAWLCLVSLNFLESGHPATERRCGRLALRRAPVLVAAATVLGIRKANGEHAISSGNEELMERVLFGRPFQSTEAVQPRPQANGSDRFPA